MPHTTLDLSLNYRPRMPRRQDYRIGCLGAGFIMARLPSGRLPSGRLQSRGHRFDRPGQSGRQPGGYPAVMPRSPTCWRDDSIEVLDIAGRPDLGGGRAAKPSSTKPICAASSPRNRWR